MNERYSCFQKCWNEAVSLPFSGLLYASILSKYTKDNNWRFRKCMAYSFQCLEIRDFLSDSEVLHQEEKDGKLIILSLQVYFKIFKISTTFSSILSGVQVQGEDQERCEWLQGGGGECRGPGGGEVQCSGEGIPLRARGRLPALHWYVACPHQEVG